jgi:hypothetical protein
MARARAFPGVALAAAILLAPAGCGGSTARAPAKTGWLSADPSEQRAQLERHLRGLDVAMLELDHRHAELYRAVRAGSWDAAAYQAAKLRLALENALERRPARRASATPFLAGQLAEVEHAIAARDAARIEPRLADLTAGCNACHAMEKVPFFEVRDPGDPGSPRRSAR